MFNLIGLIIILIIIGIILFFRNKINNSDNTTLKNIMKINDFFTTIRFVLFIFPILFLFIVFSKK